MTSVQREAAAGRGAEQRAAGAAEQGAAEQGSAERGPAEQGSAERGAGAAGAGAGLTVRGLTVAFPTRRVVDDVSFDVPPASVVALVGQSGSGKSVTARSLLGLAGAGAEVAAEVMRLGDDDLTTATEADWRRIRGRRIGLVLQDALSSLDPLRTVGREVGEALRTGRPAARAARVRAALTEAGVPDPDVRAAQYPHQLSGGLRQRALIASAIVLEPQLVIADEPTTALDVTVQQRILALLRSLADAGRGVLLITHDLAVVAQVADHVHVMHAGRIVESGSVADVLERPQTPYTQALLRAVPSARSRGSRLAPAQPGGSQPGASGASPPGGSPWSPSSASPPGPPLARPPAGAGSQADDGSAPGSASRVPATILRVSEASVSFRARGLRWGSPLAAADRTRSALDGVSLELRAGEVLGVVGESGSGKTTLGRAILGLQRLDGGRIELFGEDWDTQPERRRRAVRGRIQTISQDPWGTFDPRLSVAALLDQPLRLRASSRRGGGAGRASRRDEARRLLSLVDLSADLLDEHPRTLSGGQRQRVAIAQALASSPELIVADEPVSALDVLTQAQILDLLSELRDETGLAIVFISHDLGVVHHLSDRIAVMTGGRIVETGPVDEVFSSPRHPYTRALLSAIPRLPPSPSPSPSPARAPARESIHNVRINHAWRIDSHESD